MPTLGVLLGSSRDNGNNAGIAAWVVSLLGVYLSSPDVVSDISSQYELSIVGRDQTFLPLGPVLDPIAPVLIQDPTLYSSPSTREWSAFISSCAGFVVVTPQYNWGYPGELKNALDHLYWEWRGKPVMIVTYGGHGGGKCGEQLRQVLKGGLKMRVVEKAVGITLPEDYIRGDERVSQGRPGEGWPEFLVQFETAVKEAAEEFAALLAMPHK